MELKRFSVFEICSVQFNPPSSVYKITPKLPTAQPISEEAKLTEFNAVVIPEICGDQVVPPLIVLRMVPSNPTA